MVNNTQCAKAVEYDVCTVLPLVHVKMLHKWLLPLLFLAGPHSLACVNWEGQSLALKNEWIELPLL